MVVAVQVRKSIGPKEHANRFRGDLWYDKTYVRNGILGEMAGCTMDG